MLRKIGWSAMTLLALLVAGYGIALLSAQLRPPFVQNLFAVSPSAIAVHLTAGALAITIGPFQLNGRLRSRFMSIHRWTGRLYVLAVTVSGIAGLLLATRSYGGLVTHFGFGLMAACWLACTWIAYLKVRGGDVVAHRAWMIRSFAVTLAAVTLRIYLSAGLAMGIDFETIYAFISWVAWVPNLIVAEWFIRPRERKVLSTAA